MFLLFPLWCACTQAPTPEAPTLDNPPAPSEPLQASGQAKPSPAQPIPPAENTLFFAATPNGWISLGCLTESGQATSGKSCPSPANSEFEIGQPGGETLKLQPEQAIVCEPTEERTRGHLPLPTADASPMGWWPADNTNRWLPASRSQLRPDLYPLVGYDAELWFEQRGYQVGGGQTITYHQVYRGDLEHNGKEDLLVEATLSRIDPDKPAPSILLRVTETVEVLIPDGFELNGSMELVGSWDTGAGSALVLIQTFWMGGVGTHLLGFNDGNPAVLSQWACGS